MKKRHLYIGIITLITLIISFTYIYAHPGHTDEDGGHHVSDTDEYHYHHGYPAHQHPDGVCPYDFKDCNNGASNTSTTPKSSYYSFIDKLILFAIAVAILFAPYIIAQAIKFIYKIVKNL